MTIGYFDYTGLQMAFESLPLSIRDVRATEDVLRRIYNAARRGLKGDTLARVAGLSPVEYRRLCELDPVAEEAAGWGHADAEYAAANTIQTAIDNGDAKIALDYLKHRADWVAKQQITVDNHTTISITQALADAKARVMTIDHEPLAEIPDGRLERFSPRPVERASEADGVK